ncbi:M20 aminoacylase family protein [Xanthobacter tagetidis]|jgi:hippurate hydrolase|uniref:Amidohydrolase n=1 Tax=Xanthobacter tagetidis TaxID=60216 RepID=A0A3L7AFA0_9HYPH|nr:M20 aminoacylase family protein [Xanthobacter tagetidis]MBB6308557.1 hippurate hydrolase [Xanthobacter tagetidis]RLP78674.1 amidohydrolase [Xanthobacter tagetidis]
MGSNAAAYFEALAREMADWRRTLHQHPELAYEERWTSDYVAEKLKSFGYEPERGLGGTGVVASLSRGAGPSVGLRADMDALPIHEQTNLPYASRIPGKMHACGHDGHMTMLLAAARYFAENPPAEGTIRFIFQPAEEGAGGAKAMIDDGLFARFPVDRVFGLHNWPGQEKGSFAGRAGPLMAAFDIFDITLSGRGAHAAMPHQGTDLLLAAAQVQTQLQSIVARALDPLESAVVSVTQIHGGDAYNVLPAEVVMRGCARHFTPAAQDLIEARMGDICRGVATSFGCEVTLAYDRRYPATVNAAAELDLAAAAARAAGATSVATEVTPSMVSEDFSFMLKEKPGCYLWLGTGPIEGGKSLHSPTFDFDDSVLALGATWWVEVARQALRA